MMNWKKAYGPGWLFSLIAALLTTVSCQHYLDVQPQGMVLPETDEEFAAIIQTHLRDIEGGGDEIILGNMKTIADLEGCADDLDANITVGSNLVSYAGEIINQKQFQYRDTWEIVRDCNMVIGPLEGRETATAKSTLSAAYAIKALCYYHLLRDYCEPWEDGNASQQLGLPLVDRFDLAARPVRADLETTASYIRQLFEKSLALDPQDQLYLFTSEIVKAFEARFLFWVEDWEGCSLLCQDILENSDCQLSSRDEYAAMINAPTARLGETLIRSHINNSSELDWYFTYLKSYLATRPASSSLIRLFGDEPQKDIRYQVAFDRKRCNTKVAEARLRLSEILLMEAECAYHLGQKTKALDCINLLRSQRIEGALPIQMSDLPAEVRPDKIQVDAAGKALTPLLQLILDERRKELYLEGDRWYELKRNGRPTWWIITNGLKYTTERYLYTAPIYKGDVDMDDAMQQNPGYQR